MNQRMRHDSAHWLAVAIMGLTEGLLREEEKNDSYVAIYEICKAGIERHDLKCDRERKRLYLVPSEN